MKMLIPKIGTRVVLTQPWTFKLEDNYRNETFWKDCHGEPKKQIYYYGYGPGATGPTSNYQTSPTPTAICTTVTHSAAIPIDTTIPAGTVLYVESYHIQKGHTPQLSLRIKKENKTKIPNGKFLAPVDDINKMEVEASFAPKYPHGRFTLRMTEGIDRTNCKCRVYPCSCGLPRFTEHILSWDSDPDAGYRTSKQASCYHTTDTAGLDRIADRGFSHRYSSSRDGYCKHFDSIQTCLNWAQKKGFTQSHVDAFIKAYDPKRIEWEKSKV